MGWGSLGEVWDRLGDPWEVRDGSRDLRGDPGRFAGPLGRSWTVHWTIREFRDGRGTLGEVQDKSGSLGEV